MLNIAIRSRRSIIGVCLCYAYQVYILCIMCIRFLNCILKEFKPERFSLEAMKTMDSHAFLSFSAGPR